MYVNTVRSVRSAGTWHLRMGIREVFFKVRGGGPSTIQCSITVDRPDRQDRLVVLWVLSGGD